MKRVTKSRLNAIHNAANELQSFDILSELSEKELDEHHLIGQLMKKHSHEVLKLLIRLYDEGISKRNDSGAG